MSASFGPPGWSFTRLAVPFEPCVDDADDSEGSGPLEADGGVQPGAPSCAHVGALPTARGGWALRRLSLAATFVGARGADALARALAHAPRLRHLDVSRNALTLAADGAPLRRLRAAWAERHAEIDSADGPRLVVDV